MIFLCYYIFLLVERHNINKHASRTKKHQTNNKVFTFFCFVLCSLTFHSIFLSTSSVSTLFVFSRYFNNSLQFHIKGVSWFIVLYILCLHYYSAGIKQQQLNKKKLLPSEDIKYQLLDLAVNNVTPLFFQTSSFFFFFFLKLKLKVKVTLFTIRVHSTE